MTDRNQDNNQRQDGPQDGGGGGGPNRPEPPVRMNRGIFGWLILIGLAIALFVFLAQARNNAVQRTPNELLNHVQSGHIKKVIIKDERIEAVFKENAAGAPDSGRIYAPISGDEQKLFIQDIYEYDKSLIRSQRGDSIFVRVLITMLPWLILFALIWFFLFRGLRNAGGAGGMLGNFGRSKHKVINKEMTDIKLDDVAGVQESKEEVTEIIEFLKHPQKFQRLGGRIPRGALLIGEPGCGKTLLAKAVAGEAEVPFYSISGSDFVEMFVGVGASRVRDLFKQAKDNAPCIIFLDEIDAVGRKRGGGFASGGHDEREQTLNAILVEMDGFESSDQVIVMAATNRPDVLDPALTRPGRFDRQISVPLPDVQGRLEILRVHAKNVKLGEDVDMERLARGTPMFSGADLAAIVNEAAIIATLADKEYVEQADLEEARDKVRFGRQYRSRKIEEDERIGTAYHEAGHAVAQKIIEHADPLHKVTIIPRGQALGATMSLPERDRHGYGARYLNAQMRVLCAGRIAEHRKTNDYSSGAAADIKMATRYARHMVLEWGMSSRLGFVDYMEPDQNSSALPQKPYSEATAEVIDEEIKHLIDEAYSDVERLIDENWESVVAIAEALLKYETLTVEDVEKLMRGEQLTKPTVSDLLDAEAAKEQPTAAGARPRQDGRDEGEAGSETEGGPVPSPA